MAKKELSCLRPTIRISQRSFGQTSQQSCHTSGQNCHTPGAILSNPRITSIKNEAPREDYITEDFIKEQYEGPKRSNKELRRNSTLKYIKKYNLTL